MNQIQCETLEWRTDKELAQLSADNGAIEITELAAKQLAQ